MWVCKTIKKGKITFSTVFGTISNASDVILDNPRGSRYNLIKVENSALKFIKFGQILVNIIFAKKKQMF